MVRWYRQAALTAALVVALVVASSSALAAGASSLRVDDSAAPGAHAAARLTDGDPATVWIEGAEGPGVGESFWIDLPRSRVERVTLFPGHGASPRTFKRWSRLERVTVTLYTAGERGRMGAVATVEHTFADRFEAQDVLVGGVLVGDELTGGRLEVTIRSVYPGEGEADTAVGELAVHLSEFRATAEAFQLDARSGYGEAHLVDGDPATPWVSARGAPTRFELRATDYGVAALVFTGPRDAKLAKSCARPREVVVKVGDVVTQATLKDTAAPQRVALPVTGGYSGAAMGPIEVRIESTWPGAQTPNVVLGDVEVRATHLFVEPLTEVSEGG